MIGQRGGGVSNPCPARVSASKSKAPRIKHFHVILFVTSLQSKAKTDTGANDCFILSPLPDEEIDLDDVVRDQELWQSSQVPISLRVLALCQPHGIQERCVSMQKFEFPYPTNEEPRRPRIGRPHAKIQKVAISVRIPTEVDAFLNEYSDEHRLLKGDVITQAVMLFRIQQPLPKSRTAERGA